MQNQQKIAQIKLLNPVTNKLTYSFNRCAQNYFDYLYNLNKIEIITRCSPPQFNEIAKLIKIVDHSDFIKESSDQYETQSQSESQSESQSQIQTQSQSQQQSQESNKIPLHIINFLEKKSKINIYKNILLGFQKHISKCNDDELIKLYEGLSDWKFKYLQKRINSNFKDFKRHSLKLKNIIKSKNLYKIFIYFLRNANSLWLQNSKIQNKDDYKEYINILLEADDYGILTKCIKYYKK